MKKFLFVSILLFLSISLFGCNYQKGDLNISQEAEGIRQSEQEQKELIFRKNQECLKYKDEIVEKFGKGDTFGDNSFLEQIFYSPKVNSCLYVEYSTHGDLYSKRLLDVMNDGYSSDPLEACTFMYMTEDCEVDEKIREYKNY